MAFREEMSVNKLHAHGFELTPKRKIQEKFKISFCKILKNEWYPVKVLLKRFHLNDHNIGFH